MSALTGTAIAAIIAGGAAATADVIGAHMQSSAAKEAAATEAAAAGKAGDYVQAATKNAQDYITASRNGMQTAPIFQAPRPMIPGATVQPFAAQAGTGLLTRPIAPPTAAPGGMILVQAPDGSQRQLPAAMRDRVIASGGKVIG